MNSEQQKAFDKLWLELWPKCRRKDKKLALQQWAKIDPSLYDAIFAAVMRQKKQPSWNKDDCAYIPYLFRWLRDRKWEDEVSLPEDHDVDELLNALTLHKAMPSDLRKHISDRFRRMCERVKTNWPQLSIRLQHGAITEAQIKEQYLATD